MKMKAMSERVSHISYELNPTPRDREGELYALYQPELNIQVEGDKTQKIAQDMATRLEEVFYGIATSKSSLKGGLGKGGACLLSEDRLIYLGLIEKKPPSKRALKRNSDAKPRGVRITLAGKRMIGEDLEPLLREIYSGSFIPDQESTSVGIAGIDGNR